MSVLLRMPTEIAIAVVERDGCFLVGERSAQSSLAGSAEFPGGKVEAGESAAEAAARECLEETGVAVTITGEYKSKQQTYAHGKVHMRFFATEPIDCETEPLNGFRWVARSQLANLKFPAGNYPLIDQLLNLNSTSAQTD